MKEISETLVCLVALHDIHEFYHKNMCEMLFSVMVNVIGSNYVSYIVYDTRDVQPN